MKKFDKELLGALADRLLEAKKEVREIDRLTLEYPDLTVELGYEIQRILVEKKKNGRPVGWKVGLTSRAKQAQMGVYEPIYGTLLDIHRIADKAGIPVRSLIHPKVEPEIAFVLKRDLRGPGVTLDQVLEATERVYPALEVIDSRYRDFKFTLPDVIADNASCGRFVLGSQGVDPRNFDLRLFGVILEKNGEVVHTGAGAAVLGHPAKAVIWLCDMLSNQGLAVTTGSVILAGAITEAVPFRPGDVITATAEHVGTVSAMGV